jgi:hypothetical protein
MARMKKNDPAYWMLEKGLAEQEAERAKARFTDPFSNEPAEKPKGQWRSTSSVYSESCYICRDPEYALMGLPLCYPCSKCGGHIAADDCQCDDCGHDIRDDHE